MNSIRYKADTHGIRERGSRGREENDAVLHCDRFVFVQPTENNCDISTKIS
jgi:hypothetical protein